MYHDIEINFNNQFPGKHDVLLREKGEDVIREWSKNVDLMQYTGLKDKNGKEIYEGDIVRHQPIAVEPHDYEVRWGTFGFTYYDPKQPDVLSRYFPAHDAEVLGNVYENLELVAA